MPILDTTTVRRSLDSLHPEIAAVHHEPERAGEVGRRLSRLGTQVTAACETAFLRAADTPAP